MRLNAAFLVACIFLLSACAPLRPEPGMNFKDFNSKSALNMRGYLIPAGMYKDVGVSRYETRWQKLQRERGEAQPANGWVFYYEKDGVMISETELLALQSQHQKELQVAQSKAKQTVNSRNISQANQRKIVQSSNLQTPVISSSNNYQRANEWVWCSGFTAGAADSLETLLSKSRGDAYRDILTVVKKMNSDQETFFVNAGASLYFNGVSDTNKIRSILEPVFKNARAEAWNAGLSNPLIFLDQNSNAHKLIMSCMRKK